MTHRDIVTVGASAGGVEALQTLVAGLPAALPGALFVTLHLSPHVPSQLAPILERVSRLPVRDARDGMAIEHGHIYVAVPDHHLLVEPAGIRVTRGPKENRVRPAIDVLFRSAAYHFGPRVIGVLLSGNLDDGTAGLWAVKDRGGVALVQAPDDAPFPSMPQNALQHVAVDRALPVSAMSAAIVEFTGQATPPEAVPEPAPTMATETRIARDDHALQHGSLSLGSLTPFTCPECHGALVGFADGSLLRFRCHVGHAFSPQTLLAQFDDNIHAHLVHALRALEERTLLLGQLERQGSTEMPHYTALRADSESWLTRVRELIDGYGETGANLRRPQPGDAGAF